MQETQEKKRRGWGVRLMILAALVCVTAVTAHLAVPAPDEPPAQETMQPPQEAEPAQEDALASGSRTPEEVPITDPIEVEPDPEKPMIALTFDDGPGPYTERLLDLFEKYGGKATFFMVGRNIESYPDTVRRAAEEGHELASHSWSHPQLTRLSKAALTEELSSPRQKILETAEVEAALLRPPYGSVNDRVKAEAKAQGIALVTWSVDPRDWESRNADKVYSAVINTVKDGDIVLCHDIHESTVDAMERLLPALQEAGYQLVTVSELLTSRGAEITPGRLYWARPSASAAPAAEPEPVEDAAPPAEAEALPAAGLDLPAQLPQEELSASSEAPPAEVPDGAPEDPSPDEKAASDPA